MSGFSDYLENELIDHVLRNSAYPSPATVYVSLHTADPTDAGTGAEVAGGSYARQAATFSAPAGGVTSNSSEINYTDMPAVTVTHFAIWDAVSAGNMLYSGVLDNPRTFTAGDDAKFSAGALDVAHA